MTTPAAPEKLTGWSAAADKTAAWSGVTNYNLQDVNKAKAWGANAI